MKKGIIIVLCCMALSFVACKKPVEPTPEPVDYTTNYVGNYLGQFTLTITSMNNQAQSGLSFPIDSIRMDIAKMDEVNAISATVTIENEPYQAVGTATEEKANFEPVHLILDRPDFSIICDIILEGQPVVGNTLSLTGSFSGSGKAFIGGAEQQFDEISGTVTGQLNKQ